MSKKLLILVAVASFLMPLTCGARVTRFVVTQRRTFAAGMSFGNAGPYERLDGIAYFEVDPKDPLNALISTLTGTSLGVEAIGQFQVLTNTYSAQFPGFGAVVNAVTRSGTNTLHGSAYEFYRSSQFDARNYFDPLSGPPEFHRSQFGGTLGGPIKKDSGPMKHVYS